MTTILDWTHDVTSIADRGLAQNREASAAERLALSQALGLLSCGALTADYVIKAVSGGYRLTGMVTAELEQACVVTLEPVPQHLEERFEAEFRRIDATAGTDADGEGEQTILDMPDVEPIDHDRIDAGRIVYETVSSALDPYPRKDGAAFDWNDPRAKAEEQAVHPFAVLKKLKDET